MSKNTRDSTLRRESPRLKLQRASFSNPLQIDDQSSEQQPNRIDSIVRREGGRLKILKSQKATYSNPLVLDEGSAEQPNKRDTRSVHFDDDDDFVTPPIKTKRNAPIVITDPSTVAKEAINKSKWRLNVEEIGQEEITKNEGKKLKIIHQKTKSRLVDVENDQDKVGDANGEERKTKKTKTTREPNKQKQDKKAGKVNVTDKFKIRNSPNSLTDMVTSLSEQHKQWVRISGFGPILDFRLEKIPHKQTCNVLEAFNAPTCSLKLHSESIVITNEDVYNVLGLPIGDQILTPAIGDEASNALRRQNLWKDQFEKTNITTTAVIERMKISDEADELFKLNFLMVLCNVLIERQTGSYVHREILYFNIQLDERNNYNWGEFLLRCLVRTKSNWKNGALSLFYTGPIIFLTIFYVDRVTFKELQLVERQIPAFKGWTMELLKRRENFEKDSGNFGKGLVIEQTRAQNYEDYDRVEEHYSNHEDE